jgi:lysophospholipase L1-like esterase
MTRPSHASGNDRLSGRIKSLITAVLSVVLCAVVVLAAEIAVRVRATIKYGSTATVEDLYTVDERIGLRVPIANLHIGRINTNSLGFRGPEIAVPKPPGVIRLAFLGASTTWCDEVSGDDYVWPSIVAKKLGKIWPGRQVDFVNGGVPGYTMQSSLKNLEYRIAPLQPDVIVIYEATNDLSGELRDLAYAQGLLKQPSFQPLAWPAKYSLLWELVEMNLRILRAQRASEAKAQRLVLNPSKLGEPFRHQLTALVRAAQNRAPVVAVAMFATQLRRGQTPAHQRKASQSAMYYMPFMSPQGLIVAYERYNVIIREVAADTGALLIDDPDSIPGTSEYFFDTVHFTDAGSRAMADRVVKVLAGIPEADLTRPP